MSADRFLTAKHLHAVLGKVKAVETYPLKKQVGWQLKDHNASQKQLGASVDLIRVDVKVFEDSRRQSAGDIAMINGDDEEAESQNRQ